MHPHPASGVAVRGQPPPPGTQPTGPLFGFTSRPSRRHLQTQITTLVADLRDAKAQLHEAQRDLVEERVEREQVK